MQNISCNSCHKERKIPDSTHFTGRCLNCNLKLNKVLLFKAFQKIIDQPEMKQFTEEIEKWYV